MKQYQRVAPTVNYDECPSSYLSFSPILKVQNCLLRGPIIAHSHPSSHRCGWLAFPTRSTGGRPARPQAGRKARLAGGSLAFNERERRPEEGRPPSRPPLGCGAAVPSRSRAHLQRMRCCRGSAAVAAARRRDCRRLAFGDLDTRRGVGGKAERGSHRRWECNDFFHCQSLDCLFRDQVLEDIDLRSLNNRCLETG